MYIKQLYTNCLAEAAYYIESDGAAAIIDPLRETKPYLDLANQRGAELKYVFETHFHADFVSGHIDLANQTGAKIIYGPTASADYSITVAKDQQVYQLGSIKIKVLHTPGHTMESSCFLLIDEEGKEHSIFTGDTLFIGDVGRPDLAVTSNISREDLAAMLYRSLHEKVMTLSDEVVVYPGHGAGSQCGKNLSQETVSTIGDQRKYNYALQVDSEEAFVKAITEGLTTPPQYFPKNAQINKQGYEAIDKVMEAANHPLSVEDVKVKVAAGATVVDTRSSIPFSKGHIPGSINIGLDGQFAVWLGTLIEHLNTPVVLVTDANMEKESTLRMARVGYTNVVGFLQGGIDSWIGSKEPTGIVETVWPEEFKQIDPKHAVLLDVRRFTEFDADQYSGAINLPLAELEGKLSQMDRNEKYYLYCLTGYRSMIAASIMQRAGFTNVINIRNGFEGLTGSTSSSCSIPLNVPQPSAN